jgi:epoxyqueuosine reductase
MPALPQGPGQAFFDPPIKRDGGVIVTHIDNRKCYPYFARFKSCSVCLKVCAEVLADYKPK